MREIDDPISKPEERAFNNKFRHVSEVVVGGEEELKDYIYYVLRFRQSYSWSPDDSNYVYMEDVVPEIMNQIEEKRCGGYVTCGGHEYHGPNTSCYRVKIGFVKFGGLIGVEDHVTWSQVNTKSQAGKCNCTKLGELDSRLAYKLVFPNRYEKLVLGDAVRRMEHYARKNDIGFRYDDSLRNWTVGQACEMFIGKAYGDEDRVLTGVHRPVPVAVSSEGVICVPAANIGAERISNVSLIATDDSSALYQADIPPRYGSPDTKTFWRLRNKGQEEHVSDAIEWARENDEFETI